MPHIPGKASISLEIILKSLEFFEKALHHFKISSLPMKMSSKIFIFLIKPLFTQKCLQKAS
jgi:hypothetical protein